MNITIAALLAQREGNVNRVSEITKKLNKSVESAKEKELLRAVDQTRITTLDSIVHITELLKAGKVEQARDIMASDTDPAYQSVTLSYTVNAVPGSVPMRWVGADLFRGVIPFAPSSARARRATSVAMRTFENFP